MHIHAYTHTRIDTYIYTYYIPIYLPTYIHTYMHACIPTAPAVSTEMSIGDHPPLRPRPTIRKVGGYLQNQFRTEGLLMVQVGERKV